MNSSNKSKSAARVPLDSGTDPITKMLGRALGGKCVVEAISDFIHQLPGCLQGMSLEQVVRHYCPAAKRGPFGH